MGAGAVILGAGQAGAQAAISLREKGWAGPIALVGDEPGLPYQRPPLSKAFLSGKVDRSGLELRNAEFYRAQGIDLLAGRRAARIDRAARRVEFLEGESLSYDHLILATGSRNRHLPMENAGLPNVFELRSADHASAIKDAIDHARHIVVVGAGFIGLEFAAIAARRGAQVTVVEFAGRVMARAVSPEISAFFQARHEAAGVRLRLDRSVARLHAENGRVVAVETSDGERLPADLVLVGVGVLPNSELAEEAGLAVGNGIVVDEGLATSDPDISAIGDCAIFRSRFADAPVRIESVQNALDQARVLADRLCGGTVAYDAVPWFWSDQGEDKLQMAGLGRPSDECVVVGDRAGGRFSVLRFHADALACVESVNRPADHMSARRILQLTPPLDRDAILRAGGDLKAIAGSLPNAVVPRPAAAPRPSALANTIPEVAP